MKAKLAWMLFFVMAACAVAALVGFVLKRQDPSHRRVPHFTVTTHRGTPLTRSDLLGEVWVAEFIFTHCSGACPVMFSRMYALQKRVPEAKYVSFSVDPERDTVPVLSNFHKMMGAPESWIFATAPRGVMQDLAREGFQLGTQEGRGPQDEIVHSQRFVFVDRYGRIRASVDPTDERSLDRIAPVLRDLVRERALPVKSLPALNAALNGASALLLLVGLCLIKAKRIGAHRACMLAALAVSSLFLISYLTAHYFIGSTPYAGQGPIRTVYFAILLSHTVLAAFIVPLAGVTLYRAFREEFDRHRRIASWTFPLWLYVSVTGVVIYFMLY